VRIFSVADELSAGAPYIGGCRPHISSPPIFLWPMMIKINSWYRYTLYGHANKNEHRLKLTAAK